MQRGYDILLTDVRCFAGHHEIPIRPLTLLLGENSTGKTTLLSLRAYLASWHPGGDSKKVEDERIDHFNIPPYELGSFATIASQSGTVQATSFAIGWRRNQFQWSGVLMERSGRPQVVDMALRSPDGVHVPSLNAIRGAKERQPVIDTAIALERSAAHSLLPAVSLAPMRAQPKRTYDALGPEFSPEGDHIPLLLSRLMRHPKRAEAKQLVGLLLRFGKDAGLFEDVKVRYLGGEVGDPFQIQVTIGGKAINLRDVGYGVSQALPVIVVSSLMASERCLLVQQPEVHLHPRAQAALGSYFAGLVSQLGRECIIETHSDFLVDRVRQEVAAGTLAADDVQILYFERSGLSVRVHPIGLDAQGNLVDPPPSYRRFFMEEEVRLLTRGRPTPAKEARPAKTPRRRAR